MEEMNDHHQQPPSQRSEANQSEGLHRRTTQVHALLLNRRNPSLSLGVDNLPLSRPGRRLVEVIRGAHMVHMEIEEFTHLNGEGECITAVPSTKERGIGHIDIAEGVPTYPLYKRLASTLYQSLSFGAFSRPYDRMPLMHEDSSLKHKEVVWIALVMEKGSELINVLENVDFELHVQEPFFSQLKDREVDPPVGVRIASILGPFSLHQKIKFIIGTKLITIFAEEDFTISESPMIPVIEFVEPSSFQAFECVMGIWGSGLSLGREMVFQVRRMENRIFSGALILFNKCLVLQVQDVRRYASFLEMLKAESLTKVLPGVQTIEEGVQIYRKFYSEDKEKLNGVLAIGVTKPAAQPFISLAGMLSGLSYGGLQRLLGFVHTVGTTVEALPPPRSTLLSSFMLPHNPNVCNETITLFVRSVAYHISIPRSWWFGHVCCRLTDAVVRRSDMITVEDSTKNRLAKDAISHLMAHCCWQNMHVVPPHGVVYEIRTAEGYGAQWSEDKNEFIGFLEPYMEDGHSNRWKH
ncbi:hypothetical protein RHSIM_Rhsim09G0020700 [Rhododendron simsii]|uniref:Uncharacterized protein n=1 Tax=Rhododendron simsii TaxID=118357 RepID=A0A834LFW3_RHOSS|nr:hypothetical protein RHSIM_Rhsim09G0020700 [Rhododendron simsii]